MSFANRFARPSYPGYGHASGFYTSTAVMVALAIGLYLLFRRWDWI